MSIVSSNMISKHYCPKCDSFDLLKLHRSYIQKHILGSQNKLQCKACGEVLKSKDFEDNIPREVPVFLETTPPPATAPLVDVPEKTVTPAKVKTPETVAVKTPNSSEISEDDFKVTETRLTPSSDEAKTKSNLAPPEYYDDERLVDETLLVKEKKAAWPYVAASVLVMAGAAYAYIWMPMTINAQENNITQMDMHLSNQPVKVAAKNNDILSKEAAPTESTLPSVVNYSGVEELSKDEVTAVKLASEGPAEPTSQPVMKDRDINKAEQAKPIRSVRSSRTLPDSGTKADRALGGLLSASSTVKAELKSPVKELERTNANAVTLTTMAETVPTNKAVVISSAPSQPKAVRLSDASIKPVSPKVTTQQDLRLVDEKASQITISQDVTAPKVVTTSDIVKEIQSSAPIKLASSTAPSPTKTVVVGQPIAEKPLKAEVPNKAIRFNKKAAALLGVSASELKALASTSTRPAKPLKAAASQPVKKKQAVQASERLLENVAVKFIQQDLDKLLPN